MIKVCTVHCSQWTEVNIKGSNGKVNCLKKRKKCQPHQDSNPGSRHEQCSNHMSYGTRLNPEGADRFSTPHDKQGAGLECRWGWNFFLFSGSSLRQLILWNMKFSQSFKTLFNSTITFAFQENWNVIEPRISPSTLVMAAGPNY